MARRQRDYAAEYARRKAREQQRAALEGREFNLRNARGHGQVRLRDKIRKELRSRLVKPGGPQLVSDEDITEGLDLAADEDSGITLTDLWNIVNEGTDNHNDVLGWGTHKQWWQRRESDVPATWYYYHFYR